MQAVLCMSAAHLHYLEPCKEAYREAETQNLACALGGLAGALKSPITSENVDVLCDCSMLLYHHAWCSTTHDESVSSAEYYFGLESLIPLAKGVKSVMTASIGQVTSPWFKVAAHRPVVSIENFSRHTAFPSELKQEFKSKYELLSSNRGPLACHFEIYMAECLRLIPVLSVLSLHQLGADISPIQSDLTRYLFTYPILFGPEFLGAMRERDFSVQIVLAHFYVAVCTLIPDKFWWAHRRMKYLSESIGGHFMRDAFATVGLNVPSASNELGNLV
jgi:hypothetical protein